MPKTSLTLRFSQVDGKIALDSCSFCSPLTDDATYTSTRGALPRNWSSTRCFRWTAAVCSLSYLTVCSMESLLIHDETPGEIRGTSDSMALSLDHALSKKPMWLLDVFGVNRKGEPNALRLIQRRNSNCKMPGPVSLRFNPHVLQPEEIYIELNETPIRNISALQEIKLALNSAWHTHFARKDARKRHYACHALAA